MSAAHLEDVGEVRGQSETQWNYQWLKRVVDDFEFFIAHVLPQEFGAFQVDHVARYDDISFFGLHIHVGKIGGEDKVVRLNRRTEQQWTQVPDGRNQMGQMTRSLEKDALLPPPCRTHITMPIENGKHVAVFQYAGEIVSGGRTRSYVVLLEDSNFIQLRTPSETVSGAVCPLTSLE